MTWQASMIMHHHSPCPQCCHLLMGKSWHVTPLVIGPLLHLSPSFGKMDCENLGVCWGMVDLIGELSCKWSRSLLCCCLLWLVCLSSVPLDDCWVVLLDGLLHAVLVLSKPQLELAQHLNGCLLGCLALWALLHIFCFISNCLQELSAHLQTMLQSHKLTATEPPLQARKSKLSLGDGLGQLVHTELKFIHLGLVLLWQRLHLLGWLICDAKQSQGWSWIRCWPVHALSDGCAVCEISSLILQVVPLSESPILVNSIWKVWMCTCIKLLLCPVLQFLQAVKGVLCHLQGWLGGWEHVLRLADFPMKIKGVFWRFVRACSDFLSEDLKGLYGYLTLWSSFPT